VAIIASVFAIINKYATPWPVIAIDIAYLYMTIQSKRNQDVSHAAFIDSLTGVKNAAAYRTMLFGIDEKIASGNARFAVAVMDISGLKNVNDEYGHSLGDTLILTAAKFICSVFSHSPVFRIGGDEFVVIMESSDYDNRKVLIEAFYEGLKNLNVYDGDEVIPVLIAFGMAVYKSEKEMRYADVFKLADRRMYEHKKSQKLVVEK
jgi:diguanylate cyclase (GGDEF)-like protein